MIKNITIIRGNIDENYHDFHERVIGLIEKIKGQRPAQLHYTITLEKPPKFSVIPFRKDKIALISLHDPEKSFWEIVKNAPGYSGTYSVTEALPIKYEKDWADGVATPGVCLLTLFRQKKGIEYDIFIDRWHNGHTPLTLKIHPIYHYNRNVVNEGFEEPATWYDGIVEEHCKTRKELFNPFRFFAKSGFAIVNMIKTYFDVNSFIDYKSIESYLVQEFHVIS